MGTNKLPKTFNQREAIKLLKQHGWAQERGGKHNVKMVKTGMRPITLSSYNGEQYSVPMTAAILRQAGIRETVPEGSRS